MITELNLTPKSMISTFLHGLILSYSYPFKTLNQTKVRRILKLFVKVILGFTGGQPNHRKAKVHGKLQLLAGVDRNFSDRFSWKIWFAKWLTADTTAKSSLW